MNATNKLADRVLWRPQAAAPRIPKDVVKVRKFIKSKQARSWVEVTLSIQPGKEHKQST